MVVSDPMGELPVRNAKYAQNCTELHLANKQLTILDGFETFISLEVLWINNNELTNIEGLEENFRIKKLYAHENKLSSLKGVGNFKFLDTLLLFNNSLRDLSSILAYLKPCRRLSHLDMFGNPLAEETNYRLKVLKAMPWLAVLDRRRVTEEERAAARALVIPKAVPAKSRGEGGAAAAAAATARRTAAAATARGATGAAAATARGPPRPLSVAESLEASLRAATAAAAATGGGAGARSSRGASFALSSQSGRGRELSTTFATGPAPGQGTAEFVQDALTRRLLARIRRTVKARRLLPKEAFLALDRRREGCVPEGEFVRALELYGLLAPGPGLAARDAAAAREGLLAAYAAPAPPARCLALGRDAHLAGARHVDYVAFCADVEPATGGRDLDQLERSLEEAWRRKPPKESATLKDLKSAVGRTLRRRRAEEEAARRAMVALDTSLLGGGGGGGLPGGGQGARPAAFPEVAEDELDALEELQLKNFFRKHDADGNGFLSRAELRAALRDMELVGRRAAVAGVAAAAGGGGGGSGGGGGGAGERRGSDEFGGERTVSWVEEQDAEATDTLDLLFNRIDANADGKISWKEFLAHARQGKGKAPPVRWTRLSPEEAAVRAEELFARAARAHRGAAGAGGGGAAAAAPGGAQTTELGELVAHASKLQAIARAGAVAAGPRRKAAQGSFRPGRRDVFRAVAYAFEKGYDSSSDDDDAEDRKQKKEKLKKMFLVKDEEIGKYRDQKSTRNRTGFEFSMHAV